MPVLTFDPSQHPELTYNDVFLIPYNSTEDRVRSVVDETTRKELDDLLRDAEQKEEAIDMDNPETQRISREADAAFRSKLLDLADQHGIGETKSRDSMDFKPEDGFGNTPIVIANMNQVTGKRMAEIAARMGGTAALPQDMDDETIEEIATYMHERKIQETTPVIIKANDRLHELRRVLGKRDMETAVVIDEDGKLLGIIGAHEVPRGANEDHKVSQYMRTTHVTTTSEDTDLFDAYDLLKAKNADVLPVVDEKGKVTGVHTKKSIATRLLFEPHVNDETGGLAILGTIGAVNKNPLDRARFLIDQRVKGIILDTAHFDQGIQTYRNVEQVRDLVEKSRAKITLIAGNVVTRQATKNIISAGGDIVKVGIGPGWMCTTRMETGTGRPQFTAVMECADMARKKGKHVWADGGIKYPRDLDLAIAAGASQGMIGSILTPTDESPGAWEPADHTGKRSKRNSGMASREMAALRGNNGNRKRRIVEEVFGQRAEGASNVRIYENPDMPSVADFGVWMTRGLTSSMTYAGAETLAEFYKWARVGIQTPSGFNEGKSKDA